jgi:hypothetical protein
MGLSFTLILAPEAKPQITFEQAELVVLCYEKGAVNAGPLGAPGSLATNHDLIPGSSG